MNKNLILFLSAIAIFFSACGGDDDGGSSVTPTDTNVNRNVVTANAPKEVTRLEFPKLSTSNSIVIVHKTDGYGVTYSVEWDYEKKSQRWSCYAMTNTSTSGGAGYNSPFEEDPDLPTAMRFADTNAMYTGSGFTRGHICPSADVQCSKEANHQTFYYTNMQPQYWNFNAGDGYEGIWVKMENYVRKIANGLKDHNGYTDTLYICKGGTIDDANILMRVKNQLIVPKYFYMALLVKNSSGYKAMAFWAEHVNATAPNAKLADYAITIDELERKTGIDFFCNLPDETENHVESTLSLKSWALE